MNKDLTEYEKDLNEIKEQILKEGNTLLTKRDLLERFCVIDKEYNGRPWNLLQILANINIIIGQEQSHPKIGHWIEITNNRGTVIALRCSCCEKSPKHAIKSDYCPNCGAKMVAPRESEDK